jgi:hypothetical protein
MEDARRLREEVDGADDRLAASLGAQGQALGSLHDDAAAQGRVLQSLAGGQRGAWERALAAAEKAPLRAEGLLGAARERVGGLFEGAGGVMPLRSALEGHCAAQAALIATLRNATADLQVRCDAVLTVSEWVGPGASLLCCIGAVGG